MTATKRGLRVTPIPLHLQPEIAGAGGGVIRATHRVWQRVPPELRALQAAGAVDEMPFLWGPAFLYDIVATEQLADIGISTAFCAADRAAYLFPAGGDYRGPRRARCTAVGGMWAVPGAWSNDPSIALTAPRRPLRMPPGLAIPAPLPIALPAPRRPLRIPPGLAIPAPLPSAGAPRAPTGGDDSAGAGRAPAVATPTPVVDADADDGRAPVTTDVGAPAVAPTDGDVVPAGDVARAQRAQLTPIDYGQARMLLWNASHEDTISILRQCGLRPVHTDTHRARLDQERAIATQHARPMVAVPPTGLTPQRETITSDTLGGQFPLSRAGNRYCITHTFSSRPHHIYVSFSANHSAEASWVGFRKACRESGTTVLADAISQPIRFVSDNGTEFRGVFAQRLQQAGIEQATSTAHKRREHGAQVAETANSAVNAMLRKGLVMARANFAAYKADARDYWDYLVEAAANATATLRRAKDKTATPLSWMQIVRANGGAPFGARGTITIQAHDPTRATGGQGSNQLGDRAIPGLYLGATANKKCRMLTEDGRIIVSSDVTFPPNAMEPVTGPVTYTDTAAWLAPFAVPGTSSATPAPASTGSQIGSPDGDDSPAPAAAVTTTPAAAPPASGANGNTPNGPNALAEDARDPPTPGSISRMDVGNGAVNGVENGVVCDAFDNGANPDVPTPAPAHPATTRATSVSQREQRAATRRSRTANCLRDAAAGARSDGLTSSPPRTISPAASTGATLGADKPTTTADPAHGIGGDTDTPVPSAAGDSVNDDSTGRTGPSFTDDDGATICVGDTVTVAWLGRRGSERRPYRGVVTAISNEDDEYHVEYDDGSQHWHPITTKRAPVLRRASLLCGEFDPRSHRARERRHVSLVARRPTPHPDVQFALDSDGNIKQGYWDGTLTLGPEPTLPNVSKADAPPDPETVYHALAHLHAEWWLHAIVRERRGHLAPINRPPTYHFTRQRPNGRPLRTKWVFTVKRRTGDGTIIKFKARECIAGWHLRRGVDFTESYSGMTPWSDVLALESLSALLGLDVHESDLTQAYAFARMPDTPSGEPVIAVSASGVQVHDTDGTLMHQQADQAWYGHPAAGYALSKHIHGLVTGIDPPAGKEVCPIPLVQNPFQPCMYGAKYPAGHPRHGEIFILHVSTDNLRTYSSCPDMPAEFLGWLQRNFQVTGGDQSLRDQEPQQFMGCRFTYHPDHTVVIDMPQYIDTLLRGVNMQDANPVATPMAKGFVVSLQDAPTNADTEQVVTDYVNRAFNTNYRQYADVASFYAHLVSSIGWIANRVGPILLHAHSLLCRVLSAPTVAGFQACKRVLRYLAGKRDMCRVYRPGRRYDWRNGDLPAWSIESDASYADDPHDRRGQGGYTGGYVGQAATTAVSKKTRRTCVSTDQSESDFAGSACKEAEYHRNWMHFFGLLKAGPTDLSVDNYATATRTGSPIRRWSPSSKQHDVNEKYVAECVERKTIAVHHKPGSLPEDPQPGDGFRPDAMTKALSRPHTEFYYDEIHGRRPLPVGKRTAVDGTALCTVTSPVHSLRSIFCGMVGVRYDDGTSYHVFPSRIQLYRGEEQ